ncbi:sugar phosphate isomerase/epimerase family protein [Mesorhizobium sp. 113-3-3]|uniref:sugar phosphate isomerase/epimerase family protein n=1 Tax=Mesorhizobium sp. 113-3-3 TaxID=2744516 RepID=UPI001926E447|nr:sugar phosphate isomerase/epimerase family protein [Mesorhizobium sp. 113-3-3]BCG82193.1 sugar phosphate isomerase [Mesorhizobium sp. 113-3-3]
MSEKKNRLILHSSVAWNVPVTMDVDVARRVGFDGIDPSTRKLRDFLNAGFTEQDLVARLDGIDIPGFGAVFDIERQGASEIDLMTEAEATFKLAQIVGARGIQVMTGPVDVRAVIAHSKGVPTDLYTGMLGFSREDQVAVTVRNLCRIADMAAQFNLLLYLEPMSWTPLNRIADNVEIIDRAGRDNIRLIIDYWHCFTAGDTPDVVAGLNKDLLYGVHIGDSRSFSGGIPLESDLRDVRLGSGAIDLKLWTDAVKATGYDDWWGCESFYRKWHQEDAYEVAREVHRQMSELISA